MLSHMLYSCLSVFVSDSYCLWFTSLAFCIVVILFLICFTLATNYIYKFLKGCTQSLQSYRIFGGIFLEFPFRYEFSLVFFNSFFNLLYYSYQLHLPIFKMLCSTIAKLSHF